MFTYIGNLRYRKIHTKRYAIQQRSIQTNKELFNLTKSYTVSQKGKELLHNIISYAY